MRNICGTLADPANESKLVRRLTVYSEAASAYTATEIKQYSALVVET